MSILFEKTKKFLREEKRLIFNVGGAFLVRGFSLLLSTFSLPLYIRYFDSDVALGVWYTILSILTWINMCDLGLGNGLRHKLTEALAKKDYAHAQSLITSTYFLLGIIILPVTVALCLLTYFVDFNVALNISSETISLATVQQALRILIIGVSVHFVLKIVNSVLYALQLSSINNVISLFVSIIPLVFVIFYKTASIDTNLIALSYCHSIAINLPLLVASIIIFSIRKTAFMRPDLSSIDVHAAKCTLKLGMGFFAAQIFFMFLLSTNEVFITKLYSPECVVEYNIYYKLFMIIGSLFMVGLTPIWSKVTKDITEKKYERINTINRILFLLSVLAIIANFIMIIVLQFIINIWLGNNAILVDYGTALIFACFGSVYILNIVLTTIANGLGKLKTQIYFYGVGAFLKTPICFLLFKCGVGWQGIIVYNSIVLLLFCAFQYVWIGKLLKLLSRESSS